MDFDRITTMPFSRARFQYLKFPGPRPLRNFQWPRGFPWLSVDKRRIVDIANHCIDQCVVACTIAFITMATICGSILRI